MAFARKGALQTCACGLSRHADSGAYFTPTQDVSSIRKNGRENVQCMYIKERLLRKMWL